MEAKVTNLKTSQLELNTGQIPGVPKNPRFIRDARFAALKKSIEDAPEMLTLRELIVYPLGKKYVVICGNMRLRACREIGYKELPSKVLQEDTPPEKLREYAIKDNNGFGEDDWDLLANEWDADELKDWGVELPTEWGVNPDDYGNEFDLPDGEKEPFQNISFILADKQAEIVKEAVKDIQHTEEYKYIETFGNSNSNGNALYLIISQWADARK